MFFEFARSLTMIFVAEMGDKTQIIAMGLALKYPTRKILIGITLGVFVNHGLAIALGTAISRYLPMGLLQLLAGALFLFFAFNSLNIEDDEIGNRKSNHGIILAVALSFFLGELGDKTQLTALSLGSTSLHPFVVLLGTTSGMVLTSLLGIFVGKRLGKRVNQFLLKVGAFTVFSIFGLDKIYRYGALTYNLQIPFYIFIGAYLLIANVRIASFKKIYAQAEETLFKKQAQRLFDLKHQIKEVAGELCQNCEVCDGSRCLVGHLKEILRGDRMMDTADQVKLKQLINKDFNQSLAREVIEDIADYYLRNPEEFADNQMLVQMRKILEVIAFGAEIQKVNSVEYREEMNRLFLED